MNQGGARKPKAIDQEEETGSFLDDAFDERTIVHAGPSPLAKPSPETKSAPKAEARAASKAEPALAPVPSAPAKFDFEHTPISQPHPRSALDDAMNDRTMVISPRGVRHDQQVKPETNSKNEPKASDFEFTPPPRAEKKPDPDFNYPPPPPRAQSAQHAHSVTPSQSPAQSSKNVNVPSARSPIVGPKSHDEAEDTPPFKDTGSISFGGSKVQEAPTDEDWNFRSEKTQGVGFQLLKRKANSIPSQHKIAVAVIVALGVAFVLFRDGAKKPATAVAETESKQQDLAQAPAKPTAPSVDSLLQLFDIAYAKTQDQARSDQNSP